MKRRSALDYLAVVLGSFLLAVSVSLFLAPCKISTGGVSGIATVLYYLLGTPLSVTTLILNVGLFFIGFWQLPDSSLIRTLVGIVAFSASLYFTDTFSQKFPELLTQLTSDIWLAVIFGSVLSGVGVGLTIKHNASTGGSDFAALMLKRIIPHLSFGMHIMIIDTSIIAVSGILFSDLSVMLYSIISLYISARMTDAVVISGESARRVEVISDRSSEIAERIMHEAERGVTALQAIGCFEKRERRILMCIVSIKEVPKIIGIVKEIDKKAFIITSEAKEVRGLGFKEDING